MLRSWWNRFIKESTINNSISSSCSVSSSCSTDDDKSNNVGKGSPRSSVRSTKDSSPQQVSDDMCMVHTWMVSGSQ